MTPGILISEGQRRPTSWEQVGGLYSIHISCALWTTLAASIQAIH